MRGVRSLLTTLACLLPFQGLKRLLLNRLGHSIHPEARIGINLVKNVKRIEMGPASVIGNFNIFGRMELLRLDEGARINFLNMIIPGVTMEPEVDRGVTRSLIMHPYSRIIFLHQIDVSGGVILGEEAWLTGMRSTLMSHVFDPQSGSMIIEPIELKRRAVVATNCTLLAGTVVGEGSLLAAGSTMWTRQELVPQHLAGGVPARKLSKIEISDESYGQLRFPR